MKVGHAQISNISLLREDTHHGGRFHTNVKIVIFEHRLYNHSSGRLYPSSATRDLQSGLLIKRL